MNTNINVQVPLPRILIYQDEDCSVLTDYLTFCGFSVISTSDENVMKKLREGNYDLCILSHLKKTIPGDLKLLDHIRKLDKRMPVIFVSDLFDYSYIIEAFNSGVDDYIVRPYNIEELVCRVKALLRRCGVKIRSIEPTYKIGDYIFDNKSKLLILGSVKIKLAIKESKTLALLCAYKNELLPKDTLLHGIWKDDNYFNKRSLDVHMCHLRSYLKLDKRISLDTVRGLGYTLTIKEEEQEQESE